VLIVNKVVRHKVLSDLQPLVCLHVVVSGASVTPTRTYVVHCNCGEEWWVQRLLVCFLVGSYKQHRPVAALPRYYAGPMKGPKCLEGVNSL
jgi:hypothetical protein